MSRSRLELVLNDPNRPPVFFRLAEGPDEDVPACRCAERRPLLLSLLDVLSLVDELILPPITKAATRLASQSAGMRIRDVFMSNLMRL